MNRPSEIPNSTPSESRNKLVAAVLEMWQQHLPHGERRESVRTRCRVPARITPADENGRPIGKSSEAELHDLSEGGIGLLMDERPQTAFLNVDVPYNELETLSVTVEVVYCRPSGDAYRVGGKISWPEST